jgi:hypothetical protein
MKEIIFQKIIGDRFGEARSCLYIYGVRMVRAVKKIKVMVLRELKEYCEDYCESNPSFKDQIMKFYYFAVMEVDVFGESEDYECELAVGRINDLIAEVEK